MKTTTLHPKILERKAQMGLVAESAVSINDLPADFQQRAKASLDSRVVEGYLFIWGVPNSYREIFLRGAFAKSIRENGPGSGAKYEIKFLYQHRTCEPMSLFEILEENEIGLYFKTKPLDDVPWADNALKQIRSGTLNNYSGGFNYVWGQDKIRYDEQLDALIITEAILLEGSVATIPSDMETYTVRTAEDVENLEEEMEAFIETLPRKDRLQARQLFTRQKSLVEFRAQELRLIDLKEDKPTEIMGIDYNYLIENLKN